MAVSLPYQLADRNAVHLINASIGAEDRGDVRNRLSLGFESSDVCTAVVLSNKVSEILFITIQATYTNRKATLAGSDGISVLALLGQIARPVGQHPLVWMGRCVSQIRRALSTTVARK